MDTILTILVIVAVFIVIPVFMVLLKDKISAYLYSRPQASQKREQAKKNYNERLSSPKFKELEEYFGQKIPQAFKEVYETKKSLLKDFFLFPGNSNDIDKAYEILEVLPADLENIKEYEKLIGGGVLAFAVDGEGNPYFIKEKFQDSSKVYLHRLDGGDIKELTDSLQQFSSRKIVLRKDLWNTKQI